MEGGRQANNNLVKAVFLLQPPVDQLSPQSGRKLLREGGREGGRAVSGMKAVHCPLCLWPHFSSLPKGMCLQGKESGEKNKVTQLFLQQALHVYTLTSFPRAVLSSSTTLWGRTWTVFILRVTSLLCRLYER